MIAYICPSNDEVSLRKNEESHESLKTVEMGEGIKIAYKNGRVFAEFSGSDEWSGYVEGVKDIMRIKEKGEHGRPLHYCLIILEND